MSNAIPRNLLNLESSLVVVLAAMGVVMAVWVYRAKPRARENQGFSLMVLSILSWVSCYHLAQFDRPTFWFRLAAAAVFMFFVSYYFFVVIWFLGKRDRAYRIAGRVILLYGVVMAAAALGTSVIISGSTIAGTATRPMFGDVGRWMFYGFVIVLTVIVNVTLMREYMRLPSERRARLQYLLIGLLLFAGLNIVFNVVLPLLFDVYAFYEIGNYSVGFLLAFTAYAMVKRELFGVRVVLATIFVLTVGVVQAIDLLVFTENPGIQTFKGAVLALMLCFGWFLVRSVQRESLQRERLQEVAETLRHADEAKTEFISIVSHQLRTPLNAIKGYLSLFREGAYGALDAPKQQAMDRIYHSSERLIHLVNDLLGISRIQMGKITLDMGDVDLCGIVQSIVDEFSVIAEKKGITLRYTCPATALPPVRGDMQKLRDCVLNLIDNAIRYTEKGGVSVSVRQVDNDIVVQVDDTGPGIDPEEARTLFQSFERGQAGRKQWVDGTGLGLYIAKQFIDLHGGTIWAESAGVGRGSSFFIRIPIAARKLAA